MDQTQHLDERAIADRVTEDPELTPAEKETVIRFNKADGVAHVTTDVASVARRLLSHDAFDVKGVRTDSDPVLWSDPENIDADASIFAVKGTVPIGSVKIGEPRDSDDPYRIIGHDSAR